MYPECSPFLFPFKCHPFSFLKKLNIFFIVSLKPILLRGLLKLTFNSFLLPSAPSSPHNPALRSSEDILPIPMQTHLVLLYFTCVSQVCFLQTEGKIFHQQKDYNSLFSILTILWWHGTKPTTSLRDACTLITHTTHMTLPINVLQFILLTISSLQHQFKTIIVSYYDQLPKNKLTQEDALFHPRQVAQFVRVSPRHTKVVGLIPGQGTYKKQPVTR